MNEAKSLRKAWKEVAASNICAQRNGYDCVLYCLKFAELLMQSKEQSFSEEKPLSIKHKSLVSFRLGIAKHILSVCRQAKNELQ